MKAHLLSMDFEKFVIIVYLCKEGASLCWPVMNKKLLTRIYIFNNLFCKYDTIYLIIMQSSIGSISSMFSI